MLEGHIAFGSFVCPSILFLLQFYGPVKSMVMLSFVMLCIRDDCHAKYRDTITISKLHNTSMNFIDF